MMFFLLFANVNLYAIDLDLTWKLTITARGNGSASYNGTSIRDSAKDFSVADGTHVTINFTPDAGYRIKCLKVNYEDCTSEISDNQYSFRISILNDVYVEFEAINPKSYTLSISATGHGLADYDGTATMGETNTFSVNEGTPVTITFVPLTGSRIKSVKVNSSDVTSKLLYDKYTVTINADTSIEVEFEAIPQTTYTLSIKASGSGSAFYGYESIRETTKSFSVNKGTKATITFSPDAGYRIKSLKVNGSAKTASSSYDVTVNADTSIEVEFEAIPATTCTLSIKATGNGSASYSGTTIKGTTKSFTVNEGTKATITFTPDAGYRIKSLKVNGSAKTASSSYAVTVNADTSVEVEFEAIPENPPATTTYTLSIKATGNGSASYSGTTIKGTTKSFTVNEGTKAMITFSPDAGYRIKSLKVNGSSKTASTSYEVTVNADTSVEVEFEAIPVTTYTLSIKATGNGSASYNSETIRNNSMSFKVNEGATAVVSFTPDNGNRIKTVKVNDNDVTSNLSNNSYTFIDINANYSVEAIFEEIVNAIVDNGITYQVASMDNRTIRVTDVCTGLYMNVPEKVNYQNQDWLVTGIDDDAFNSNENLAAIIWNPMVSFTGRVKNPNLLLYIKDQKYAPSNIKNVIVNNYASSITLTDAKSGNNFYCPISFTAENIAYSHRYRMKTGIGESRGWETIALPFDVQKITLSGKGEIVPFANWKEGDATKPFWLYQLSSNGFVESAGIKANTPYIISLPNNDKYVTTYCLSGEVTFSAENVEVKQSDNVQTATYSDRTFVPNYTIKENNDGYFALNVNNEYEVYQGGENEGSRFIRNLRQIHPFEAYMTSSANTRSIVIFDGMDTTTSLKGIKEITGEQVVRVYDLSGKLLRIGSSLDSVREELPAGIYIVNNRKIVIK